MTARQRCIWLVAIAVLVGGVAWVLLAPDQPPSSAARATPESGAVTAGSNALPSAATRARLAQLGRDPAPTPTPTPTGPALDCSMPAVVAAAVDHTTILTERLCNRLSRLGANPAAIDRSQARQVLQQLIDATLVQTALARIGGTVSPAEIEAAMVTLGADRTRTDPALVREQLAERLALDHLLDSRGQVEVADADVEHELALGAPGLDRGAGIRLEGWIARALETASREVDASARASIQELAQALRRPGASGGATPRSPQVTRLAPFVLGDHGVEPALSRAVGSLATGEWTDAVRTRAGWVVVRALGWVGPANIDPVLLRARVRDALARKHLHAGRDALLASLRTNSRIEILLDL